jgi:hypothetical protein
VRFNASPAVCEYLDAQLRDTQPSPRQRRPVAVSLVGLSWADTGASDIHLLPGLVSPELKRLLRADDLNPATNEVEVKQLFNMAGLTVAFAAPQLAGTLASHGITMSTTTGEVTVDTAAMKGHSFLITAIGTQGSAIATARIRVNVHSAITRLWLTPSRLTVRKGAKNMRLSVLAEFDDGVIGDITNWSPFEKPVGPPDRIFVRAKSSDTPVFTWEAESIPPGGAAVVAVERETGVLNATAESGSAKITARRQGGGTASATVACAKPWSTQVRLTHISGPGVPDVNFVPNILFLPDGFQDGDKGSYERLVRFVVTRLSTRNRTRPFAAFTGRINYFMGWVPSPDPGISVLNELDRGKRVGATTEGKGLELPSVARRAPDKWKLEDLINAIGLPTPKGDPDGSPLDDARVAVWRTLYGTDITKPRVQPLYADWLARNDRVLLNERDTAFHMAFGDRPALDGTTTDRGIAFNPRRLHEDDFNTFLDALRGPKGEALGNLWTSGKDNDLVVILCRTNRHGGLNATRSVPGTDRGRTLGVSLRDNTVHRAQANPGGDGFDLVPDAVPTEAHFRIWLTIAHELAHSWTLGDEYGGDTRAPTGSDIAEAAKDANIQARSTLVITIPGGGGELLSTATLKWGEWPRIAKAGVLMTKPGPAAGGKFILTLQDGKAARFRPKDIVRLRTRPLPVAAAPSARCKVESVTGDQMVIAPLFGAAVDPAKFPGEDVGRGAGSIVMAPVRSKDTDPAADVYGGDLTLVDFDALARIDSTSNPLNAQPLAGEAKPPNDDFRRACRNVELPVPTPATNFPDRKAPKPPAFSSWTIGLYENGGKFNCGIYRPTGICLMSGSASRDTKTKDLTLYDFCLICRYAIVDAVDPTLHREVEKDFRARYGKRGAVP